MKTRTIRQSVSFKATPHEVYEILMDERKHAEFTGGRASISRKIGGKFSVSDGYIVGENIELVKDRKIVQSWKAEEDCWPKGHYSKVVFSLEKTKDGTKLSFVHTSTPAECGTRFDEGWKEFYWKPMKEKLESGD
jgi:activator of HSP90 ATPase